MKEKIRYIFKYLIPGFEELELWSMGLSIILISIANYRSLYFHFSQFSLEDTFVILVISYFAFCAILFSMVQALITARKDKIEKSIMLVFAMFFTICVGGISGALALKKAEGFWFVFPAWNLLNVFLLLVFYKFNVIDEREISNENASGTEVIVASFIVLIIFGVSNYILKNNWAITLSMCVAFSCNLSIPIIKFMSFFELSHKEG
jgi:hypothetical protein